MVRRHMKHDLDLDSRAKREFEMAAGALMQDPLEIYDRVLHALADCKARREVGAAALAVGTVAADERHYEETQWGQSPVRWLLHLPVSTLTCAQQKHMRLRTLLSLKACAR